MTRMIGPRRSRRRRYTFLAILGVLIAAGLLATVGRTAVLNDSGSPNVIVPDKTTSKGDQTNLGAFVSYLGDSDTTFGSSGTGTFTPFVRLQGSPTEQGYNTDGTTQFDTKVGTWTHSIKVSQIPVRPCAVAQGDGTATGLCFELFVDINESNTAKYVSLNTVDIWFTQNASLTGYPFTASGTTTEQYKYNDAGGVLIHDVNQGSGRGDLRYDIPVSDFTIPAGCNYGNSSCNTFFVLYSKWGSSNAAPDGNTYASEGGFEEWKVKVYPIPNTPAVSTTVVPAGPIAIGGSANDTATITGATATAGGTITYKLYSNNDCSGLIEDLTPATNTVVNGVAPASKSHTFNGAGTFYFYAEYSGDLNNTGPVNSGCAAEPFVVSPHAPAPHSTPVVQIKDTLTVTGLTTTATTNATGNVVVGLYTTSGCSTGQIGSDETFDASTNVGGTLTAATSFVGTLAGTYYYKISYAGDTNNTGFTSCAESVGVTITSLS